MKAWWFYLYILQFIVLQYHILVYSIPRKFVMLYTAYHFWKLSIKVGITSCYTYLVCDSVLWILVQHLLLACLWILQPIVQEHWFDVPRNKIDLIYVAFLEELYFRSETLVLQLPSKQKAFCYDQSNWYK